MGEEAEYGGVPRREFRRLFEEEVRERLLEVGFDRCTLRHDAVALKVDLLFSLVLMYMERIIYKNITYILNIF